MKESKLIEMNNKVETLGNVIQELIREVMNLRDLSVGTLETVKLLPGYEEAIKELVKQNTTNGKEDANGTPSGDSGSTTTSLELE